MAYTVEQIDKVFSEIIQDIEDGKALRTILKYSGMPSSSTFYIWIEEDEKKSKRYARACEVRADNIFEDILSIADESENDVKRDKDGNEITNGEVIQRSRLRVDARKWYLSKLSPKKYGDKIETTLQGGDRPLQTIDYGKISTEALREIAKAQLNND